MRYYLWNMSSHSFLQLGDATVIGRSTAYPNDSVISGKHCEIICRVHERSIQDLNSKNGTYINGKKIEGKVDLQPFDLIEIGEQSLIFINDEVLKVKTAEDFVKKLSPSISEPKIKDIKNKLVVFYKRGTVAIEKMLQIDLIKADIEKLNGELSVVQSEANIVQKKLNDLLAKVAGITADRDRRQKLLDHEIAEFNKIDESSDYTKTLVNGE